MGTTAMRAPGDHARPAVPLLVASGAMVLFTTLDALVKSLPHSIAVVQVGSMRFGFAVPIALLALLVIRAPWPTLSSWKANGIRGMLNVATMVLFFAALRRLPFAEVMALTYVAPLMVALLATVFLGERLRAGVLAAVLLGLVGVGAIAWEQWTHADVVGHDVLGLFAALGSATTYAASNLLLRRQAQRDSAASIVLIQNVVGAIALAPVAATDWTTPQAPVWAVFAMLGLLGVAGHFLLTWAYARAPAGLLGVVDYLALPYVATLGFVFWGEVPTPAMWGGAVLIVAACVIATRRPR